MSLQSFLISEWFVSPHCAELISKARFHFNNNRKKLLEWILIINIQCENNDLRFISIILLASGYMFTWDYLISIVSFFPWKSGKKKRWSRFCCHVMSLSIYTLFIPFGISKMTCYDIKYNCGEKENSEALV